MLTQFNRGWSEIIDIKGLTKPPDGQRFETNARTEDEDGAICHPCGLVYQETAKSFGDGPTSVIVDVYASVDVIDNPGRNLGMIEVEKLEGLGGNGDCAPEGSDGRAWQCLTLHVIQPGQNGVTDWRQALVALHGWW